jgi:hypothetical protein
LTRRARTLEIRPVTISCILEVFCENVHDVPRLSSLASCYRQSDLLEWSSPEHHRKALLTIAAALNPLRIHDGASESKAGPQFRKWVKRSGSVA